MLHSKASFRSDFYFAFYSLVKFASVEYVYLNRCRVRFQVKKRQQRVFMILESKNVPFVAVDITEPGKEDEKDFMQTNSKSMGCTVSDTSPRHPLPPQIFNDQDYCGVIYLYLKLYMVH